MTTIKATKRSSPPRPAHIGASANLPRQLPLIGNEFPEIRAAHPATINLGLERPLLVLSSDHRTQPIKWQVDASPPETFDILRVKLQVGTVLHDGWLYVPHGSPHRKDLRSHEVILASKIVISDGEQCTLHIPRKCVAMPYGEFPLLIVW